MAYEVLTAFFLEAGFLGIMLFGREKVGDRLHMLACAMVAVGTAVSATWILSVNSWMQTPAGFSIAAERPVRARGLVAIIFNPSFPYRLAHTLTASYLTTAFMVGGRGGLASAARTRGQCRRAAHVLHGHVDGGDRGAAAGVPRRPARPQHAGAPAGQGDGHGGHYQKHPEGAPLILFGLPNDAEQAH
jgi:cytochrome d ubiquinol oxidase subunit I